MVVVERVIQVSIPGARKANNVISVALLAIALPASGEVQLLYVLTQPVHQMKFKLHRIEKAQEKHAISTIKIFAAKRRVRNPASALFSFCLLSSSI